MDLFKNFRVNIQLLRIEKGLSAKMLSLKLGFNEKRVTNFEQSHNPTAEELLNISKYFKVPVEDIVFKKAKVTF